MPPDETINDELRARIYNFLMYLKVARRTDPVMATAMMLGDEFRSHVKDIEKLAGWTKEDDVRAVEMAQLRMEETEGVKLAERSHRISKSLLGWALAGVAAAAAGGAALYYHWKKKGNGNGKEKSAEK